MSAKPVKTAAESKKVKVSPASPKTKAARKTGPEAPAKPLRSAEAGPAASPKPAGTSPGLEPSCSECATRNCYRRDSKYPNFCLTEENQAGAEAARELYTGTGIDARIARAAAEVECEYYGRLTRLEETIIFALKMGAKKLGVASCIGLLDESSVYVKTARSAGLKVKTVICKVGSVDKCDIGLPDSLKLAPGTQESCCNPVLQAQILNDWGADVNVSIGLCVGHDYLFTKHSQAPAVTLAVKDRVLGHNPLAAVYASKFYYKRILNFKDFPKSRLE
jgi:uncharacterized metal-binding protein